jgi:pSer/pThr/pTyr-binding forkhead associated (FHA) protein
MALITLQVLDGADRGRVFRDLPTPVTIGREEGNTIQLNDERVSRFHLKIQEDQQRLVLTDLQSTNGTKVNGEEMELRILRYGDMVTVGRSVLLFGSREQIASRLSHLRKQETSAKKSGAVDPEIAASAAAAAPAEDAPAPMSDGAAGDDAPEFDFDFENDPEIQAALQSFEAPELPDRLSPAQAAQLADLLNYLHIRIRQLIESVRFDRDQERVSMPQNLWQNLLELQMKLAEYLRLIGDPDSK